jgi:hypothetical protein
MIFERQDNGDKRAALEHALSTMLHAGLGLPNEEMTQRTIVQRHSVA